MNLVPQLVIEKISHNDLVHINSFDCGNEALNTYLRKDALTDPDSVTYIVYDSDTNILVAYFSLSCGAIYFDVGYKENIKFMTYRAVEIKNFAVCRAYQDLKFRDEDENLVLFSAALLEHIKLDIIFHFTENHCGASRIILYSTPVAVKFYRNSGFKDFLENFIYDSSPYLEDCVPMMYIYE